MGKMEQKEKGTDMLSTLRQITPGLQLKPKKYLEEGILTTF